MGDNLPCNDGTHTRCVVITGGSRGIGAEVACHFAKAGYNVAITYRQDYSSAQSVINTLINNGVEARAYCFDLGSDQTVDGTIEQIHKDFGRIDVLVNNAARFDSGPFEDIDAELFDKAFRTNLFGPISIIQQCMKYLPKGGRIINIISALGVEPKEGTVLYAATKAALRAVTQGLVSPLARQGVTINCVAPGVILTDMMKNASKSDLETVAADTPMGRVGVPSDIAPLVVFLASAGAEWLTGRTYVADGGRISF